MWAQGQHAVKSLDEGFNANPKPIVLYFHTDWCSYCAIQSKQLKKDTSISKMLNNDFYFIDFNAESREQIIFNGSNYKGAKNSTHELVQSFFPNSRQIAYPAWVILDKNYKLIFNHQGLLKPDKTERNTFTNP
jgi:thioredoxin-related protein